MSYPSSGGYDAGVIYAPYVPMYLDPKIFELSLQQLWRNYLLEKGLNKGILGKFSVYQDIGNGITKLI